MRQIKFIIFLLWYKEYAKCQKTNMFLHFYKEQKIFRLSGKCRQNTIYIKYF